jgi:hypothetical protein
MIRGSQQVFHRSQQYICIAEMENVINTKVFGMSDSPSMWYFPRSVQEDEGQLHFMGDINLLNTKFFKVRLFMNMIAQVFILDNMRRSMLCDFLAPTILQCM